MLISRLNFNLKPNQSLKVNQAANSLCLRWSAMKKKFCEREKDIWWMSEVVQKHNIKNKEWNCVWNFKYQIWL